MFANQRTAKWVSDQFLHRIEDLAVQKMTQ